MAELLMLLLMFALVGFVVYLIVTYIPMPAPFAQLIIVFCVILMVMYLIGVVSGNASLPRMRFPN